MGEVSQTKAAVDWNAIYVDNLPRVYHFFCYRVGDTALAEDLTSITFEKAWRNRHRYQRDEAGFQAWLFTIARNVATDHFRKRPQVDSVETEVLENLPAPGSLEHLIEQKDTFQQLNRLLRELAPRDRELIALKYGTELSNRRIGQWVGMTETHVSTQINRLVQKLRVRWDEQQGTGEMSS